MHADPIPGAGIYNLNQSTYSVVEGETVFVTIQRTQGAVLTADVEVTVQLRGGTADIDYPNATVTQVAKFLKDTNPTQMQLGFQTLNQARVHDVQIQVTILSVTGGGQVGPLNTAIITILGRGTPRIQSVAPRAGGSGTVLNVGGVNFDSQTTDPWEVAFIPVFAIEPVVPNTTTILPSPFIPATFTVLSPTQMLVTVPGTLSPGDYHLKIRIRIPAPPGSTTPDDFSISPSTQADIFTYTGGPTITSILPSSGPSSGGTLLTIIGTGFSPTACPLSVTFGGIPAFMTAPSCQPISTTQFKVTTPTGAAPGVVDVVVTTGAGTSPVTVDTKFTYTGGPVITSITPPSGPTTGGLVVSIAGTGFLNVQCPAAGPTGVRFGGVTARCTVLSSTLITAISPPNAGVQQISVTSTSGGVSAFTTAANFTYVDGPSVQSISPAQGPPAGGTAVTITGAGFAASAKVRFGATLSAAVFFDSSTQIRAVSPPGTGTVDVIVDVAGTLSPNTPVDDFAYSGPQVTQLTPNAGPLAGGTVVTITGSNLVAGATVNFADKPATEVTFVSPTVITAKAPAGGKAGPVDVKVTTPSGTSIISPATIYTYTDGPIVTGLDPKVGPTTGGTIVVLTGTNFPAPAPAICDATVKFGDVVADQVNCNSATQITVLSPAASAGGTVHVRVSTPKGLSPVSDDDQFEYQAQPPVITAISPATAPTTGGTTITITGLGFKGVVCPDGVRFGTLKAISCTVTGDTTITAVAPPNAVGATFLGITSAVGTNAIVQNFTYVTPGSEGSGGSDGGGSGGSGSTEKAPAGVTVEPLPVPSGLAVQYQLSPRWSMVLWRGQNAAQLPLALGTAQSRVTAIYAWDGVRSKWLGYFTGVGDVPGGNDFTSLFRGVVYWVAISKGPPLTLTGTDIAP